MKKRECIKAYSTLSLRNRGLSLIPILIISSLMSLVIISSGIQVTVHQRASANANYQSITTDEVRAETEAQIDYYAEAGRLARVNSTPTSLTAQRVDADEIEGFIVREQFVTKCVGSSFNCANFQIETTVEVPEILAERTIVTGFESVLR